MMRILMVLPEVKLFCMAVSWQGLCRGCPFLPAMFIFAHTNYIG